MIRPTSCLLGALLCATAVTVSAQRSRPEAAMADAARAFLASLDAPRREKAVFPFNADERLNWHYIPRARKGLPYREMTPEQQKAALALLAAGLSEQGYGKVTTIRGLEAVLRVQENNNQGRDPDGYFFSIFGEPSVSGTWGWRYEGHHISQNWTLVQGKSIAGSPQFMGSNPATVGIDVPGAPAKGTRALAAEEDLAHALAGSLDAEQKKEAVLAGAVPNDILNGPARKEAIAENTGLMYGKLRSDQQGMLLALIREYAGAMPRPLAEQRLAAIRKAGLEGIRFAWIGPLEKGQKQYYRVQGPNFLIEYDNTSGNHIHCVWRDFKGDFGMDLLAMHYRAHPHRVAAAR